MKGFAKIPFIRHAAILPRVRILFDQRKSGAIIHSFRRYRPPGTRQGDILNSLASRSRSLMMRQAEFWQNILKWLCVMAEFPKLS